MPTTYAIPNGRTVMDATTYTGNGSTQSITNTAGFKPDLVWYKNRSTGASHNLFDSVRGATKYLISNDAAAEGTASGVTSFDSNGFSVGSLANGNGNGNAIVGWQWQAGQGTTSTNNVGSISSTTSVNATAGFSIVTWTGNGVNSTVGHGLGVAPSLIITKGRSASTNWVTYHTSLGNTKGINLDTTGAAATSVDYWNNTSPTSSVFTIAGANSNNANGLTVVAYCWAQVAGFSAFGLYTGNNSSDGPFIYTGFRPKYVLIKREGGTGYWVIFDSSRQPYNSSAAPGLWPNVADAEANYNTIDILSNGIKIRETSATVNGPGYTYIYAIFAENPFKYANAR